MMQEGLAPKKLHQHHRLRPFSEKCGITYIHSVFPIFPRTPTLGTSSVSYTGKQTRSDPRCT